MFFLFARDILARSEGAAVAVSSDVDHDGNRLILTQIIAERRQSMASGEYVRVSSQSDTEHADPAGEEQEPAEEPGFEREELAQV